MACCGAASGCADPPNLTIIATIRGHFRSAAVAGAAVAAVGERESKGPLHMLHSGAEGDFKGIAFLREIDTQVFIVFSYTINIV